MDTSWVPKRFRGEGSVSFCNKRGRLDDIFKGRNTSSTAKGCEGLDGREARISDTSDTIRRLSSGDVPEVPASWDAAGAVPRRTSAASHIELLHEKGSVTGGLAYATPVLGRSDKTAPFDTKLQPDLRQQLLLLRLQEEALLAELRQSRKLYDLRVAEILSGVSLSCDILGQIPCATNSSGLPEYSYGALERKGQQPAGGRLARLTPAASLQPQVGATTHGEQQPQTQQQAQYRPQLQECANISAFWTTEASSMAPPPPRPPRSHSLEPAPQQLGVKPLSSGRSRRQPPQPSKQQKQQRRMPSLDRVAGSAFSDAEPGAQGLHSDEVDG